MPKAHQLDLEKDAIASVSPQIVNFARSNGDRSSDIGDMGPSLTRQEFAEECDINVIMERYERTGVIDHTSNRAPFYFNYEGDIPDLQTAMQIRIDAERAFMTLPAKVRKEFDNDPVKFVEFATDPDNLDQMREWELAPPAPPPAEGKAAANDDEPPKAIGTPTKAKPKPFVRAPKEPEQPAE